MCLKKKKKQISHAKLQFPLQDYLYFILEVLLFPEIKFHSNPKPQLLPKDNARVMWVNPPPEGFTSPPRPAVPPWSMSVCVRPGEDEQN